VIPGSIKSDPPEIGADPNGIRSTGPSNYMDGVEGQGSMMNLPPGEDAFSINAFNQPQRDADWLKQNLDNEEEVLRFLDDPGNNLEEQPTEILIELAQKLKERRTKHYEEMLKEQQEQDRKAAEQVELNQKVVE